MTTVNIKWINTDKIWNISKFRRVRTERAERAEQKKRQKKKIFFFLFSVRLLRRAAYPDWNFLLNETIRSRKTVARVYGNSETEARRRRRKRNELSKREIRQRREKKKRESTEHNSFFFLYFLSSFHFVHRHCRVVFCIHGIISSWARWKCAISAASFIQSQQQQRQRAVVKFSLFRFVLYFIFAIVDTLDDFEWNRCCVNCELQSVKNRIKRT